MKHVTVGVLAHVDAGKTTFSESVLLNVGKLRRTGRVDHGDTALDTHELERQRGITIFASQAIFPLGDDLTVTLLDTPGHVDFSSETERVLQVLDYAILIISGTDGVQPHTATLWKLLESYTVPTFVFVTKMDFARKTKEELLQNLTDEFGAGFVDFSSDNEEMPEQIALCDEEILDAYTETGVIEDCFVKTAIRRRRIFPVSFGSGLKNEGVNEFLSLFSRYSEERPHTDAFGGRVFKVTYDAQGNRLTHLKVTGGVLRVRDSVRIGDAEEKVSALRLYTGSKFEVADEAPAGAVCAAVGLESTESGMGLGVEASGKKPILEPVIRYRIELPDGEDPMAVLPKLKKLEEEDPTLHISWDSHLSEIHVGLMGTVQAEILKALILDRLSLDVKINSGRVMYRETVKAKVEGIGHYEPLRHYSEVHLILEPLPRGEGIKFANRCSENDLDRNWQRLILTHLAEKQHLGVLTGSPITDMKITLAAGRAHIKHTEGGDFREATYRAVRHGLRCAESVLLEPYCAFRLEVPTEQIGRAINDILARSGSFEPPQTRGALSVLTGRCPMITISEYAAEVAAYSGGVGRLSVIPDGYDLCHNPDEVTALYGYDPDTDMRNPTGSVFCAHGAGFFVPWNEVDRYAHLESCLEKEKLVAPTVNHRNLHIDEKELEAIMLREFGPIRRPSYRLPQVTEDISEKKSKSSSGPGEDLLIVDGYNVIFAWDDLKALAKTDLGGARHRLCEILSNYSSFRRIETVLVFDGYLVAGNPGEKFDHDSVHVVFTKENETGDIYIEKLIGKIGKNDRVRVVTSDGLIQLSAIRNGILRMSAAEFEQEIDSAAAEISDYLKTLGKEPFGTVTVPETENKNKEG